MPDEPSNAEIEARLREMWAGGMPATFVDALDSLQAERAAERPVSASTDSA
jgi:hypothetical protein